MRPGLLVAACLAMAGSASAQSYSVTSGGVPIGEQPSVFRPTDLATSTFRERPQNSQSGTVNSASSFGLKNMDAATRTKTEDSLLKLGARREGKTIIVALPADVLFDFDKSAIRKDARPVLAQLIEILQAMSDPAVTIVGHTDSKGSDTYNQALSERRSASVQSWLQKSGAKSAMTTQGKGESSPRAANSNPDGTDNPSGRQLNRRVEFIIEEQ